MKILSIDRFENKYAICVDDNMSAFAITVEELPEGVKSGDVLVIDNEGNIKIDVVETEMRKKRIAEKKNRLFSKK